MGYDAVSFPNLGIGEIKLHRTAFTVGSLSVQWYAVIIVIGIIVAYLVCDRIRRRLEVSSDDFLDCILWALPIGIIGARVFYVLGDLKNFHSFMDVIAVWNGGLAIYGGVVFAGATVFAVCKLKKCDFRSMLDLMAFGMLIGQMIGRWGNFVNIEVYGVATNLPWAMGIGYFGEGASELVHPLFLYESLWNLIGFVLIFGYMDFRKFKGEIFLWYLAWYGLGRAVMEPMRDPEFNLHLFGLPIMLVLAIAFCVTSVVLIIVFRRKSDGYIVSKVETRAEREQKNYEQQFHIDNTEEDNGDTDKR